MSKKHKKVFTSLNYIEPILILVSAVTGCIFVSVSVNSFCFCFFTAIAVRVKKHKSIIKKKKKKHDKVAFLAKIKLISRKI